MIFVKYAMLHPLKTFQTQSSVMTSSVNHQSARVCGTKDIGMRLPTNWLLDHNSIACFPTKAHHSLSFSDVALAFLT